MLKAFIKNKLFMLILLSAAAGLINFIGCDDSGIETEPETTDTNVVRHYNIAPTYWFQGSNDTSHMSVNLLEGRVTIQDSTNKDMELIDFQSDTTNFRFRSGDQSLDLIGFKTRFNRIYANLDSAKFDTLSVIPDSDNNLTPDDFTQDDTWGNSAWPYFAIGQTEKPVYSFYLQGRNTSGTNFIYGVFHVRKVERVSSINPVSIGVKVTVDIKLNKAGKNSFKQKIN